MSFMYVLFKLMNTTFQKPETITYVEELEGYFSTGMGLRKLGDKPLTYSSYGAISPIKEKELNCFFSQLPTNKEIMFDMSIYQGMGAMFYESIKTLSDRNPNIKWINYTENSRRRLTEAGIKPSSIK